MSGVLFYSEIPKDNKNQAGVSDLGFKVDAPAVLFLFGSVDVLLIMV